MTNSVSLESNYCNPRPLVSYFLSFLSFLVRLHKLDTHISSLQNRLTSLPRFHPLRVPCVQTLAKERMRRYCMLDDSDDLELSIIYFTETIFLPLPWQAPSSNVIQIFFSIAFALGLRAKKFRHPEDVTRSVIYLRYLHGQSRQFLEVSVNYVTGFLVLVLGLQAEMKLGNVRQDIEEMAGLCQELLKSDMSTTDVIGPISDLTQVVEAHFRYGRLERQQEPSDKLIECLREASILRLDSHEVSSWVSFALIWALFARFRIGLSNDDYEEATAMLDKLARIPEDDLTPNQLRVDALYLAYAFASYRSIISKRPEYREQAIHRCRTLLAELPPEHSSRSFVKNMLTELQKDRSYGLRAATVDDTKAFLKDSEVPDRPPFQDLIASLTEPNADSKVIRVVDLPSMDRIADEAELEEAVKYCRLLLASSHHDSEFALLARIKLSEFVHRAFLCTNKIEYLNEEISILRDDVYTRSTLTTRANYSGLISSLSTRLKLLHRREDFNEIMQLFPMAVNDEHRVAPDRFPISCLWARTARRTGHTSTSAAYASAMQLMQDSLTFAPTLDKQHSELVAMRDSYENLPLDHASYRVSIGQLQRAIETLEQGRALIWSEMRGLRTSIDQIRAIDSHLADKFANVNRDLEMLTLTISANINDDDPDGSTGEMDPFGRLVVQQRKLLDDRKKLISQIQALSGFETFLKSSSFDNLRSAAARGPVIIIIHCQWRSDIIILHHSFPPSLLPTADDFYHRANNMRNKLLGARKEGLDSSEYEDALRSVLKELYNLVGQPVIQKLKELGVPEQSRIWWCPTSVFCSLPLHAMGPIPQLDGRPRYFLDLYIPSYTPTLSTLIESNNSGSDTLERPSILLVSPPDAFLPGASGEMRAVQARSFQVTTLRSETATPATVLEHLRDHRFMHIVSHGELEQGKPFDASFKLYGNKRLSLLDIVRSRLPEADFAFLSACHTAELTEDSIADEGIHLTAAMQYSGFRSVVGTMWELLDIDGEDIAKNFYKGVFSGKNQGVRYYERTAEALRDAVIHLREKKQTRKQRQETPMTLERWVNFVHYGA